MKARDLANAVSIQRARLILYNGSRDFLFFSVTLHDHNSILILNHTLTKHFSKPHNLLLNFFSFVFDTLMFPSFML